MNDISDGAIMAALGRQMTTAVAKQVVAAGNLANIDTPGYRTREASFGDLLDGEVKKLGLSVDQRRTSCPASTRPTDRRRPKSTASSRAATATTCSSIASC